MTCLHNISIHAAFPTLKPFGTSLKRTHRARLEDAPNFPDSASASFPASALAGVESSPHCGLPELQVRGQQGQLAVALGQDLDHAPCPSGGRVTRPVTGPPELWYALVTRSGMRRLEIGDMFLSAMSLFLPVMSVPAFSSMVSWIVWLLGRPRIVLFEHGERGRVVCLRRALSTDTRLHSIAHLRRHGAYASCQYSSCITNAGEICLSYWPIGIVLTCNTD